MLSQSITAAVGQTFGLEGDRAEHPRLRRRGATAPRSRRACARRGRRAATRDLRSIRPSTKPSRPASIRVARAAGQLEAGLVRRRQHVGGERDRCRSRVAGARREVAGQAVAVEVGRAGVLATAAQSSASLRPTAFDVFLLEADEGIGLEVAARSAGELGREPRAKRDRARRRVADERVAPAPRPAASSGPSSCASVACSTRTGTAATTICFTRIRSARRLRACARRLPGDADRRSAGTVTGQTTSLRRAGGEHDRSGGGSATAARSLACRRCASCAAPWSADLHLALGGVAQGQQRR